MIEGKQHENISTLMEIQFFKSKFMKPIFFVSGILKSYLQIEWPGIFTSIKFQYLWARSYESDAV